LLKAVLDSDVHLARQIAHALVGEDGYLPGGDRLAVEWIPQGTRFKITENDGWECVRMFDKSQFMVA